MFFRNTTTKPAPIPEPSQAPPGINLTKGGVGTINLTKGAQSTALTAHLDWDGGSARRRSKGADLELYALYVPKDPANAPGPKSLPGWAVYWNNLGSPDAQPYIHHHGDSLTPGRETLTITRPDQLSYVLICAYSAVGNGAGSFKSYGAHAIVTDGQHQTVTVPLYDNNPNAYWATIALINLTDPTQAGVTQAERYSRPGSENRPMLYNDGKFEMDAGPVEFKH